MTLTGTITNIPAIELRGTQMMLCKLTIDVEGMDYYVQGWGRLAIKCSEFKKGDKVKVEINKSALQRAVKTIEYDSNNKNKGL